MKATEIICNEVRMWKVTYFGIPGQTFLTTEEKLFELCRY